MLNPCRISEFVLKTHTHHGPVAQLAERLAYTQRTEVQILPGLPGPSALAFGKVYTV